MAHDSPALFTVHTHPDLGHPFEDEGHHNAGPGTFAPEPAAVWAVYAGARLNDVAAHAPWLLLVLADGSFRPVNAAFTRACLQADCRVKGCRVAGKIRAGARSGD